MEHAATPGHLLTQAVPASAPRVSSGLPSDVLSDAARRLELASLVLAGVGLFLLVDLLVILYRLSTDLAHVQVGAYELVPRCGLALTSAVVFVVCRSGRLAPARLVALGLVYEVVASQLLSFGEATYLRSSHLLALFFPVLVPAGPRATFLAALLACLNWSPGLGHVHGDLEFRHPLLAALVVDLLVAAMAAVQAAAVHHLGDEVSRARQLGSYTLDERLGQGGMGEVWRAHHALLARPAAVKLIRPDVLGSDEAGKVRERFEREAQATASLTCPHTIVLYDYGMSADGRLYYVMELLDGLDLDSLVTRFGPLPTGRAVHLLRQLCLSLEEAHGRGLVHRDVKPANVYVGRVGRQADFVKVLDFGLVRWVTVEEGDDTVEGTPAYMAPEQMQGEPVTTAADMYAVGGVAWWLLTGREVFEAPTLPDLLMKVLMEPLPPTPAGLPAELDGLVRACLSRDPLQRPTAALLGAALERCAVGAPWTDDDARAWWQAHVREARR